MMPKNAKYIIVDYNDLVTEPQIEIIFSENPDRIFDAFQEQSKKHYKQDFLIMLKKLKKKFVPELSIILLNEVYDKLMPKL